MWWNSAELALAEALYDSVHWCSWLQTKCRWKGLHLQILPNELYKAWKKNLTALSLVRFDWVFFYLYFMMFSWHDPAPSHIGPRACCQLCYEQHFCLLQWNRLGAGWPWIARLTGKGYFQDSGKSHSCLQNVIKDSQTNTSENVPFLRGKEDNKRDEQIIPLLLNYQHF